MPNRPTVTLLLVEDDDVDVMMVERALGRAGVPCVMRRAEDGRAALEILRGENGQTPPTMPVIVFADINMPRMSGLEMLAEIRRDPALTALPVFILTTSRRPEDVRTAWALGIAGYILKEDAGIDFAKFAQYLEHLIAIGTFPD